MDEEKTKKEMESEDTAGVKDDGAKFETTPVIERAREEREKMEAANVKREELLDREEAIMAKRELGGRAEAGGVKEKPKELSDTEYVDQVMGNGKE